MNQSYYTVQVIFQSYDPDFVTEIHRKSINEFSCSGIEEFSMDEPAVDDLLGDRSYSGGDLPQSVIDEVNDFHQENQAKHIFYFSSDKNSEDKANAVEFLRFLNGFENKTFHASLSEEEVKDWNAVWRSQFKLIEIDKEMAVIPSWEKEKCHGKFSYPIVIYPGQGFGTGNHETTFLCLKALKKFETGVPRERVMDYGCGSGILGIGARRLGFKKIDLYDIDPLALENSKINLTHNFDDASYFRCLLPEDKSKFYSKYNVVFANILAPVLESISSELYELLESDGLLILSGILVEQEQRVREKYLKLGLELLNSEIKGDWCCLVFKG